MSCRGPWPGIAIAMGLALLLPGGAAATTASVEDFKALSGATSFTAGCGLHVPPPLGDGGFRPPNTAIEPDVRVNPRDANNIVGVWIQDFGQAHVTAATKDGGKTWTLANVPGLSDCVGGPKNEGPYDPWLSFGADGTVYLSSMRGRVDPGALSPTNAVVVNRSDDGGLTWGDPVTVEPPTGYNDHPAVLGDLGDPNKIYIAWAALSGPYGANLDAAKFSISQDKGRTWSSPKAIFHTDRVFENETKSVLTQLPDGTLVYTFRLFESETQLPGVPKTAYRMVALVSRDGGTNWSREIVVGRPSREEPEVEAGGEPVPIEGGNAPAVAVSPSGRMYMTWTDLREHSKRVMIASTTNGVEWTQPTEVASSPRGMFLHTVAVSGNGALGVLWYDLREDRPGDSEATTVVRFANSQDEGRSWQEQQLAGPYDTKKAWEDPRGFPDEPYNVGDYVGLAGLPDGFASVFTMAAPQATVGKSQAFFAKVRLPIAARRLKITVSPRRLRSGHRAQVVVRVTVAGGRTPVVGAAVRIGRTRVRTNRRGRAVLHRRFRGGRFVVRAEKAGFVTERIVVRVKRAL